MSINLYCSSAVDLAAVGEVTVFTSPADGTCSKFHRCNLLFSGHWKPLFEKKQDTPQITRKST